MLNFLNLKSKASHLFWGVASSLSILVYTVIHIYRQFSFLMHAIQVKTAESLSFLQKKNSLACKTINVFATLSSDSAVVAELFKIVILI